MSIYAYTCKTVKGLFYPVMPKHRPLTEDALQLVARRFAVLAEPMRLRLIQALLAGERNVSELVRVTGGTQANISRHLQTLVTAHVLDRRKEGLQVFYRIADPTIPRLCELVCGSLGKALSRQAAQFEPAR
jgi:DNA-binding transcriptional ArsR family regulator